MQIKESLAFKYFVKQTQQEAIVLKREFDEERLKNKINVLGSLYGVPSTQLSKEMEFAELSLKMVPMITKPTKFLTDGEIDSKFKVFQA